LIDKNEISIYPQLKKPFEAKHSKWLFFWKI